MPQAKLTQTYVQSLKPSLKRQIFRDLTILGLVLFVEPSGKKTWYADYTRPNGKRTYRKIGPAEILTVTQARDVAQKFLASVTLGNDPIKVEEAKKERMTLRQLIAGHYRSWVVDSRRSGEETLKILARAFVDFMDLPTDEITLLAVEQWRANARREKGLKASSLNRRITALKAVLKLSSESCLCRSCWVNAGIQRHIRQILTWPRQISIYVDSALGGSIFCWSAANGNQT